MAKNASNKVPALLHLYLQNILNMNLVSGCIEEIYKLQPILHQSDNSADLSAVISLHKAHNHNSGVFIR